MNRKERIDSLIKELEDKYPCAKGLYKGLHIDALCDPNIPESQADTFIKDIEELYRTRHENNSKPTLKELFNDYGNDLKKLGKSISEYGQALGKYTETWKTALNKAIEAEATTKHLYDTLAEAKKNVDKNGETMKDLQKSVAQLEKKSRQTDSTPAEKKKLN